MAPFDSGVSSRPQALGPDLQSVENALEGFDAWLRRAGYSGYDQYDLWATRYGIRSKGLYYRWGKVASPLIFPLVMLDWLAPQSRRWLCPQRRYPTADAHYLMGFVTLHRALGNAGYLDRAARLAEALIRSSIPGFSGPAWGYPFDWQSRSGLCRHDTPLITATPYVFDAFMDLFEVTGQERYREYARAIAQFVASDIHDTPSGRGYAASYTPSDRTQVINCSAYRAACLARASVTFGSLHYRQLALGNVRFVLDQQQANGAWLYAAADEREAFVDHMHTCFVLKGLYRTYLALGGEEILQAVRLGYQYYRRALFYPNGLPRPFAQAETTQFRVAELYDYAEALNLALLLQPEFDTLHLAHRMASSLVRGWQTPAGHFITRISTGGVQNRVPYHRWGQAPAFRSLALYYSQARTRT